MITIVPYNPQWQKEFSRLKQILSEALGELALRIDHIGSTSVPGLAAKDVIDVQVTVRELSPPVEAALETIGYTRNLRISGDHVPPHWTGSEEDWQKWIFDAPPGERRTHLHVRVQGRPNQRYPLLFRDYLRAHPVAAEAYALIKQQLARHFPEDVNAYYDIKDPVCDIVWDAAQEWAKVTQWTPED